MPNESTQRIIDLSLALYPGMAVYPGDPPFAKTWECALERDRFNLSRLELGAHVGTHVDAPLHFLRDGMDVASMALERFCGLAVALDVPKGTGENVSARDLEETLAALGDLRAVTRHGIVLLRTGWEARAGTADYFDPGWPGLELKAAEFLIGQGVKAVGGDFPSVESPAGVAAGAPVHRRLAEAGMPIFECLVNLGEVAGKRFWFCGLPLRIVEGEASPVRAVAVM